MKRTPGGETEVGGICTLREGRRRGETSGTTLSPSDVSQLGFGRGWGVRGVCREKRAEGCVWKAAVGWKTAPGDGRGGVV